jgi:hypothetical protein
MSIAGSALERITIVVYVENPMITKMKHHKPRRRKDQPLLVAHLKPSHIKNARSIKKNTNPEKNPSPKLFTNKRSNFPASFTSHWITTTCVINVKAQPKMKAMTAPRKV